MNNWSGIGRLVADPEIRYTNDGKAVGSLRIAINRPYKNANGNYEADFLNCIAFGKTAELIGDYFKKGERIAITGRVQSRTYKDKNDKTVYVTEIVVGNIDFIESKKSGENAEENPFAGFQAVSDEDIPF